MDNYTTDYFINQRGLSLQCADIALGDNSGFSRQSHYDNIEYIALEDGTHVIVPIKKPKEYCVEKWQSMCITGDNPKNQHMDYDNFIDFINRMEAEERNYNLLYAKSNTLFQASVITLIFSIIIVWFEPIIALMTFITAIGLFIASSLTSPAKPTFKEKKIKALEQAEKIINNYEKELYE